MKNIFKLAALLLVILNGISASAEIILLENPEKHAVKLNAAVKERDKDLVLHDRSTAEDLIKMQKEEEIKDIEALWNAAVNNNSLIKFTISKLNTPESQRRLHSSLMAKTLSSLIYGASFVPMFTGADALIQSAAFSAGRLANNYINKASSEQDPKNTPITDTELIQLAGAVEDLQERIISSYYEYKSALNKLKDTRTKLILYNKNYSNALKTNSMTELIVSSALYEDMQLQEYRNEQEAKKCYLSLERLAGQKTIDSLILSQYALKNQLVNKDILKQQ